MKIRWLVDVGMYFCKLLCNFGSILVVYSLNVYVNGIYVGVFLFVFFIFIMIKKVNKGSFFERLNIKYYFCKYNFLLNWKFEFFIEFFDLIFIVIIINCYDIKKKNCIWVWLKLG